MQTHVFFPGPHVTHDGRRICESCGDVDAAKGAVGPEARIQLGLVASPMDTRGASA
jgi:hypothetical protein